MGPAGPLKLPMMPEAEEGSLRGVLGGLREAVVGLGTQVLKGDILFQSVCLTLSLLGALVPCPPRTESSFRAYLSI